MNLIHGPLLVNYIIIKESYKKDSSYDNIIKLRIFTNNKNKS